MKWMVYLLLLANLGFFAWHFRMPPERAAADSRTESLPDGAEPLLLLGESKVSTDKQSEPAGSPETAPNSSAPQTAEAAPLPEAASAPDRPEPATLAGAEQPPVPEPAQAPACYSIGRFSERASADAVRDRLQDAGLTVALREERKEDKDGYWVVLPPRATRAAAISTIDRLKRARVRDYFLVRTGEMRNAVSLGLYSSEQLARRRESEIRALGFAPRIDPVKLSSTYYWVDVSEVRSESVAELQDVLQRHPQVRQVERRCP